MIHSMNMNRIISLSPKNIFVEKKLTCNLLCLTAVRALKVLKQIETVQLEPIIQQYLL